MTKADVKTIAKALNVLDPANKQQVISKLMEELKSVYSQKLTEAYKILTDD